MAHHSPCPARVRRSFLVVLVGALLLSSCSTSSTSPRSQQTPPIGGGQLTPLLDSTLSVPRWFVFETGGEKDTLLQLVA